MICPFCQTTNADDANFCLNCGQRISLVCSRCSRRVLGHARFCDGCGSALTAQPQVESRATEHRLVESEHSTEAAPAITKTTTPDADGRALRSDEPEQVGAPPQTTATPYPAEEAIAPASLPQPQPASAPAAGEADQDQSPHSELPPPDESPQDDSPLTDYIPKALMRKLEAARSSGDMVGERRVVTMLFCDLKGSTAAAENLDPEENGRRSSTAPLKHMIKPIYTYEGTVARLNG